MHTDHAATRCLMQKKDAKPRLIRWVLLLQGFDMEIWDKRIVENVVANHLSCVERKNEIEELREIVENFPNEQLMMVNTLLP